MHYVENKKFTTRLLHHIETPDIEVCLALTSILIISNINGGFNIDFFKEPVDLFVNEDYLVIGRCPKIFANFAIFAKFLYILSI